MQAVLWSNSEKIVYGEYSASQFLSFSMFSLCEEGLNVKVSELAQAVN